MKPIFLLIICLFINLLLQAQVSKTIEVATPGSLSTLLTNDEMATITDLTLTGTMDARDFRIMRDSMPKLENVDMEEVKIAAYTGPGGTISSQPEFSYPENVFPTCAFFDFFNMTQDTATLRSIVLPSSISAIGNGAFDNCTFLESIDIPSHVTLIEANAFLGCLNLAVVNLPPSLTTIERQTFQGCSKLSSINIPASMDTINELTFFGCTSLDTLTLPKSIKHIGSQAFNECTGITTITIPSSVSYIGSGVFSKSINLKTIYVNASHPIDLTYSWQVFKDVNKNTCTLHVPYNSKNLYEQAVQWKDFKNIVEENSGIFLNKDFIKLNSAGTSDTLKVSSNTTWHVSSLPSWLTISQSSGTGDATILFTAADNTGTKGREATLIFSGEDNDSRNLLVVQEGQLKTINMKAGELSSVLTPEELNTISNLKITGTLDARDFKTMRDNMPLLSRLDISEVTVASYRGSLGSYIDMYYPANEIPENAFYFKDYFNGFEAKKPGLTSIILPASITSIGKNAFYWCNGLTAVNIPSKVTIIKESAFGLCSALTSIKIPAGLSKIEYGALTGCNAEIMVDTANKNYSSIDGILFNKDQTELLYYPVLRPGDYTMPSTVKSMYGFNDCTGLTSIHLSPLLTTIYNGCFTGCTNLTEIYIPSSINSIELDNTFAGTKAYFIVDAGNQTYTSEDGILFNKAKNVLLKYPVTKQGSYVIPPTVTSVYYSAFSNCINLTSVTIPASIDSIHGSTFWGCINLTSVTIPSSVTYIGGGAFSGCSSLTSIIIPSAVATIENNAFTNCTELASIYCYPYAPPLLSCMGWRCEYFGNVNKETCILYVPFGRKEVYGSTYKWNDFKNIVEMPGFMLSDSLAIISLKEGSTTEVDVLANVDWTASSDQSWLTLSHSSGSGNQTITFTAKENTMSASREAIVTFSAADVASQTFTVRQEGLPKTLEVTPGGLLSALTKEELKGMMNLTLKGIMDARDFKIMRDSMPVLTTVDLSEVSIAAYSGPEGTASVYDNISDYPANEIPCHSFNSKTSLIFINLPNSATSIGTSTFAYCSELTTVNIPVSVVSIADNTFNYCTKLTSLHLPDQLTTIGNWAFAECFNLTTINIPSSVKDIGSGAFQECQSLTSVTIPSSVTAINNYTFSGCRGLTSLYLPTSVTSIGESAFGACLHLTSLIIPEYVSSIGDNSFGFCNALTSITIPSSVTSIGSGAFSNCSGLTSIYANPGIPVDLSAKWDVFMGVNTTSCKLIVPFQSKVRYAAAPQWKDFKNMEEATAGLTLDVNHLEYDAQKHNESFGITANVEWTVSADQPWITFDTPSGNGSQRVTVTTEANPTVLTRNGQITVSSPDVTAQIITVIQEGLPATFTITAGGLLSSLTDEELKGITHLTLEGTMDARDFKSLRDNMPLLYSLDLSRVTVAAYTGKDGTSCESLGAVIDYPANEIPAYAFWNVWDYLKYNKLRTIVLPQNIKSVGENAFRACRDLTSIEIPEGTTAIKAGAFGECIKLTNISFPSSLIIIGNYVFFYCTAMETVDLPASLTIISERLFEGCDHLASIVIPASVTKIESSAFTGCTNLISLTIPASVESFGFSVFAGCTGIHAIYSHAATPVVIPDYYFVFSTVDKTTCKLYVPTGSKALYSEANEWREFVNIVEMTTATDDMELNKTPFTCYPNPFTRQLTIDIANPSRKEISVDIFSISGQKIRSLARTHKEAQISLTWNGNNDAGQKVPNGLYLLKVNEQTIKVMVKR